MKIDLARHLPRGLSARIPLAVVVLALLPALLAGLIAIGVSVAAVKGEAQARLQGEVAGDAKALARGIAQFSSGMGYLAASPTLRDLLAATTEPRGVPAPLRARAEADLAGFVAAFPALTGIRLIGLDGREILGVDRRGREVYVLAPTELADQSARKDVREGLATGLGRLYVAPLAAAAASGGLAAGRPALRISTGVADAAGALRAIAVATADAEPMVHGLGGNAGSLAYLLDASGDVLRWSPDQRDGGLTVHRSAELGAELPRAMIEDALRGRAGSGEGGDRLLAHAPVTPGGGTVSGATAPLRWSLIVSRPQQALFAAAAHLRLLYGVLALCLAAAAAAGWILTRRLMRPLTGLRDGVRRLAGHPAEHRIEIRGRDEIAELGTAYNRMADTVETLQEELARERDRLERQVAARTTQLAQYSQVLDRALQHTSEGILVLDRSGRVELANGAACRLLGVGTKTLTDSVLVSLWPPAEALLDESGGHGPLQLDHGGRALEADVSPLAGADERAAGWILRLRDRTAAVRREEERSDGDGRAYRHVLDARIATLAATVAEGAKPLARLQTVIQSLLGDGDADERRRALVGQLAKEIERLGALLKPLPAGGNDRQARCRATSLAEAAQDVLRWTRLDARLQGVAIDAESLQGALPALWADPDQLRHLLLSLVDNAIQAMAAGGTLRLAAAPDPRQPGRMVILVADDGEGIAEAELARIFDPLFTTRPGRIGLGLALVRRIVAAHRAEISIASAPGKGTRIRLSWPIADADSASAPVPAPENHAGA